ncbi:MAG: hypothetical protein RMJ05_06885 [Thermomicrobium sp.]|nr:hypothetical protein [Thermomicrobium sp.]MDW8059990.1 hypothetical protein [Thermomicrobium sp.]
MGEPPAWYRVIRAARYLGVAPWELLEREAVWFTWGLAAEAAEAKAERARAERATRGRRWQRR